jgi:N4-gp56 family major capsid protein
MSIATGFGDIPPLVAARAEAEALSHAEPVIILGQFGLTKPQPKNKTDTVIFRRFTPMPVVTAPLTEGITPTAVKIGTEQVQTTLKQWGNWAEPTDKLVDMGDGNVVPEMTKLIGENAAATTERVIWGVLRAGTNVYYANGTVRSAVNTALTLNKQFAVTRGLKNQKAKPISAVQASSTNYGSVSIERAYIAVGHTDLEYDIRQMAGFKPYSDYANPKSFPLMGEIGRVNDVRYCLSPDLPPFPDAGGTAGSSVVSTSGTSADVYPIIYLGEEAFGQVPLAGSGSITPIVGLPKPASGDPLGQRGFIGWKAYFNALILNDLWMARFEVAVTKL